MCVCARARVCVYVSVCVFIVLCSYVLSFNVCMVWGGVADFGGSVNVLR